MDVQVCRAQRSVVIRRCIGPQFHYKAGDVPPEEGP